MPCLNSPPYFPPCAVSDNYVVQNRQAIFASLDLRPLQSPCLAFDIPRHPPSNQCNTDTGSDAGHSGAEAFRIPRRVLAQEDLRTDSTANLAVAVDKSDRERRASGPGSCLHTPRPHHREPGRSHCIADESGCVNGAVAGICYHDSVASQDDGHESQRVDGSR